MDIFSRRVVGWEVHDRQSAELAAELVQRTVWRERGSTRPLVLHADNGSSMKGATMKTTFERLGVMASYSRPCVSNDNPFSGALFRTCKYRPNWPTQGFATKAEAQDWVRQFARWYNGEHLHSGIRFLTPNMRHSGQEGDILNKRSPLYENARAANPARWSGTTRNWQPSGPVWLNPEREKAASEMRTAA